MWPDVQKLLLIIIYILLVYRSNLPHRYTTTCGELGAALHRFSAIFSILTLGESRHTAVVSHGFTGRGRLVVMCFATFTFELYISWLNGT